MFYIYNILIDITVSQLYFCFEFFWCGIFAFSYKFSTLSSSPAISLSVSFHVQILDFKFAFSLISDPSLIILIPSLLFLDDDDDYHNNDTDYDDGYHSYGGEEDVFKDSDGVEIRES